MKVESPVQEPSLLAPSPGFPGFVQGVHNADDLTGTSHANEEMYDEDEDDDEDDDETPYRGSGGKRKIDIRYIKDRSRRHITFSKRKFGIMKKAYELSTLTGTQVLLLVVSETGLVYTFTTPKLQSIVTTSEGKGLIQACLNTPEGAEPRLDMLRGAGSSPQTASGGPGSSAVPTYPMSPSRSIQAPEAIAHQPHSQPRLPTVPMGGDVALSYPGYPQSGAGMGPPLLPFASQGGPQSLGFPPMAVHERLPPTAVRSVYGPTSSQSYPTPSHQAARHSVVTNGPTARLPGFDSLPSMSLNAHGQYAPVHSQSHPSMPTRERFARTPHLSQMRESHEHPLQQASSGGVRSGSGSRPSPPQPADTPANADQEEDQLSDSAPPKTAASRTRKRKTGQRASGRSRPND